MLAKFTKFFLIIGILIIASIARALPGETDLKVTIMVFSGHTNPSYFFPSDSIPQFVELFKTVSVDNKETMSVPTTLEYHGVLVNNPSGLGNLPERFFVNKGHIEAERQGVRELLIDKDRKIEEFLVKKARELEVIDDKVLNFIVTGKLND